MVEAGLYDKAADEIVRRYGLVKAELVRRNKGKKPFRMEPVSPKEEVFKYTQMTEEDKGMARQEFGEAFTNYEMDIQDKIRRYQNA